MRRKNSSSAYSRAVRSIARPARVTRRVDGSSRRSPTASTAGPVDAAPEQRAHARQQLGELERLGEVVVGAAVEAGDLVGHAGARRQQQDRHLPAARAQLAQDGEPVAPRQHDVEDEQVVLALERAGESRLAVVRDVDLVVLGLQPALDEARHLLLVLDDQDAHRT